MRGRRIIKRQLKRDAFTLIELMIVIAIIGVLAAIAVPNFKRARERANVKACWANQKTCAGALEMYNLDKSSSDELSEEILHKLVDDGYLQAFPKDPGHGDEYSYDPTDTDYGITCKNHGSIGGDGTAGGGAS